MTTSLSLPEPTTEAHARWERGYRCHGLWRGIERLGYVGLGPSGLWDGIYRWGVDGPGVTLRAEGTASSLNLAKVAVEKEVGLVVSKAARIKELGRLRFIECPREPWLDCLVEIASKIHPEDQIVREEFPPHFIGPVTLMPGITGIGAQATIASHTDRDELPWSYLLILRSSGSQIRAHGHHNHLTAPRQLVELNIHRRHKLIQQGKNDLFIFLSVEYHERTPLEQAFARHRSKHEISILRSLTIDAKPTPRRT